MALVLAGSFNALRIALEARFTYWMKIKKTGCENQKGMRYVKLKSQIPYS